ncbi:hypothetical protein MTO96_006379 [Rhipicephalus appendiculatus]
MSCCAYGCRSRFVDGKKLFALPSGKRDRERRLTWLLRIGRADFTGTTSTRLCEVRAKSVSYGGIFTPFLQIKQEVTGIPNLLSATSDTTLQISDIRTEDTSTNDFKDHSLHCTHGIQNLLSATSQTTLQISDIRTEDTSTNDFKDHSLNCTHGIQNLLSATSETTLQISDIRTEGTFSDYAKDPSLNCPQGIQDSLAATSETTLQISDIRTADAAFWSESHGTSSGTSEEKPPLASYPTAAPTFSADPSADNGAPVCNGLPPESQVLPSLSYAELHKRMLELEYKVESTRRKMALAYRAKSKVQKEYDKLKAEVAYFLAPDQLHCMAKSSRGALWSEGTIRKALKVRLACGSRGYNLVKKILAPLPSQRTLQRHLEVNGMEDHEKDVIDVGEVEVKPGELVDPSSGEILGVPADPSTDTPD